MLSLGQTVQCNLANMILRVTFIARINKTT